MCEYFCIGFIDFVLKGKSLLKYKKTLSLSIVYGKCGHEYEKIFKEDKVNEISKFFCLISNIERYQKIYNHT